ncbi:ATP-binding protein [Microtetraspora sp. AC03309]|uniref:ATP-binding protein n=1 Tax=Microtetraspora sp. AC03309 TaxID=2779376 RepID=UPI001E2A25AF|nr:ATP-binding protein [Microtetraspora sp. AC03309]MCC5579249.1 ATP-binding protein [Microtetraspora sp. AC03309]
MNDQDLKEFDEARPGVIWTTVRLRRGAGEMLWWRVFPGRGDQVAPARKIVRSLLEDTQRADDAEWVAAELISNALLHTRSGAQGGYFVVEVARNICVAKVLVYDLGGGGVPVFGQGFTPSEHGHGLRGVAALANRVGLEGDPVTGHVVWAQLVLTVPDAVRTAS